MPSIELHYYSGERISFGEVAPGVRVEAEPTEVYDVEIDRPLHQWRGDDITNLLNIMASIAGRLQSGATFTVDPQPRTAVSCLTCFSARVQPGPGSRPPSHLRFSPRFSTNGRG